MADPKIILQKLHKNLNILQEREAKYGGHAPLELLNQITDHQTAIALTEQRLNGQLSEAKWREALKPLLLAIKEGQVVNVEAKTYIAGDVQGDLVNGDKVAGDKVMGDKVSGGVNIGNVQGGIHGATIAGRDVTQHHTVFDQRGQQVGTQHNIAGDLHQQGGDTYNMSGDFRGASLNIKSTLTNVTQTINASSVDLPLKVELNRLIGQLSTSLERVPAEQAEQAEAVAKSAELLVNTATEENPNKTMLQISGEGLKQAAQNLAAVTPAVLRIVTQIMATVMKSVR